LSVSSLTHARPGIKRRADNYLWSWHDLLFSAVRDVGKKASNPGRLTLTRGASEGMSCDVSSSLLALRVGVHEAIGFPEDIVPGQHQDLRIGFVLQILSDEPYWPTRIADENERPG
jgi:hypothetical protein